MLVIRPIRSSDLADLMDMARDAGMGLTSLPPDEGVLSGKIKRSEQSFAQDVAPEHAKYFFAMEDLAANRCVGICGIEARVGLDEVWYNYRLSTSVNASRELGVYVQNATLYLTNDMTNCSEICSLLLHRDWRKDGNGPFLSRARFLFLADFADLFSDKIFAEMRGVSDEQGNSPFWNSLGSRFFNMDFHRADVLTGLGDKSFIAELMPKHPIYVPLLQPEAQEVIGRVHDHTRPALHMLETEGFNFNGLVDIFDAGPVIEAFTRNIRCVRESDKRYVMVSKQATRDPVPPEEQIMVSNRSFSDFRVITVPKDRVRTDTISLTREEAEALALASGDIVRFVALKQKSSASQRQRSTA
ncbi:arginine N-succinyltransferase [Marinobacteraceae bacterium S3BR75-40.1]